jgi:hypothetical protein
MAMLECFTDYPESLLVILGTTTTLSRRISSKSFKIQTKISNIGLHVKMVTAETASSIKPVGLHSIMITTTTTIIIILIIISLLHCSWRTWLHI